MAPLAPALSLPALHAASCGAFALVLVGYAALSLALQLGFYRARAASAAAWRSQPRRGYGGAAAAARPWLPALVALRGDGDGRDGGEPRAPEHAAFASLNLLLAAAAAAATTELALRGAGGCRMYGGGALAPATFARELLAACAWESAVEYAWHRMMHLGPFYRAFHRWHHFYRAPRPFDDMMIHPVEALGYYCILYSPPFVFRMHGASFAAYMVLMGLCGVLDHCGARIALPGALAWLYNAADHDRHHELCNVNFGFPTMVLDHLLGTYASPNPPPADGGGDAPLKVAAPLAASSRPTPPPPTRRRVASVASRSRGQRGT